MATLWTKYDDFMERTADPRVKNWVVVGNPSITFGITGLYLLLVLAILPSYMKNKKPFDLKTVIKYYNIFQIVACCGIIYITVSAGWWQGKYHYGCQTIDYSNDPWALKLLNSFYWVYWLKMVEMIETVFFLMRKKFKQVSGLHVYHHASTFLFAWLSCTFIGGGMSSFPQIINSFIHVLMYTYYYLSSLGPKWQKRLAPWKPRLTMCQMIQFVIILLHSSTALHPDCHVPKKVLWLWVPNVVIIFKMFKDFYVDNYTGKRRHSKSR